MKRPLIVSVAAIIFSAASARAQTQPKPPFTLSKETTVITAPLNPNGTPNYIQALNDKYGKGVTPENNGFVVYLQAVGTGEKILSPKTRDKVLQLAGAKPTPPGTPVFEIFEQYGDNAKLDDAGQERLTAELSAVRQQLWKEADHPQIAAYLAAQEKLLDLIVQASTKPRWWCPSASGDGHSMFDALLPSMGIARGAANALAARATLRAGKGDINGFIRDVTAIEHLGRLIGSGPTLIERLVGIAICGVGHQPLGAVGGAGKLTEIQCKSVASLLDGLPPEPSIVESADVSERWTQLDVAVLAATKKFKDSAPGDGQSTMTAELAKLANGPGAASIDWDAVMKTINHTTDIAVSNARKTQLSEIRQGQKEFDASLAKARSDLRDRASRAKQPDEVRDVYTGIVAQGITNVFLPDLSRALEQELRAALQDQMAKMLLAAGQVHAKTGKWPATLSDLAPAYVKQVPRDLYPVDAPGELRYTVTPDGIRITSFGENNRPFGVGIQLP